MSNILKGIQLNEVSPHDYDSDWDYQDALARSGRPRSSYRSQEDDTFDSDVAYSRKVYQATKAAKEKAQRDADHNRLASGMNEEQLDELSPETLASYKKKAGAAATQADKQGDYKLGNKRFSGIVKATKKQFAQDEKNLKEFAPVGGDDREPDEEEILRQLASKWWLGTNQEMAKAQRTLAALGWEIGQDESGDDDAGVFLVRPGDEHGDTYIAFNHSDLEELNEDLHKWFQEKWVRFGPDGKIRGDCARGDDSEGKPKCLPQSKAHSLGKKGRASAASRKRREDPNPERSGKAINVNTKKKSNESINESIPSDNDMGSTPRGSKMTLGQWKQMWQKKMPNADMSLFRFPPSMPGSAIAYFDGWMNNPDARWDPQQGVAEGSDNPWGDQGNFVGDTPVNLGGAVVKNLTIGDIVSYLGQKAKILAMSKTGNTSRIHIPSNIGGVTKDVLTKDLKRTSLSEEELDEACWKGYHKEGNKELFGKTVPNCVKNEGVAEGLSDTQQKIVDTINKLEDRLKHAKTPEQWDRIKNRIERLQAGLKRSQQGVAEEHHSESCPHCGGEMVSEELMNEKKDACYYKVKSRYKVWPSAYASGALVKCRKKGADSWGNGGKKNESIEEDDAGDVEQRMIAKIQKEKQRLAKLKQTDPEAYNREMAKSKSSSRVPPVSTFEGVAEGKEELHAHLQSINQKLKLMRGGPVGEPNSMAFVEKRKALLKQKEQILSQLKQGVAEEQLDEKWSKKYKDSINCSNPKGFSQKAHCAGKQKNESAIMSGLNQLDEGWKEKLGAAALAGSMALGAAGANARVTPDGQGGFTGGLKPTATVTAPSDNKPAAEAPSGFSKEYLQKAADPNRTGRYMISVEKAQELLKNMP